MWRLALCWAISSEESYAKKSAEIIDAWSQTLKSIGNQRGRGSHGVPAVGGLDISPIIVILAIQVLELLLLHPSGLLRSFFSLLGNALGLL